MVVGIDKFREHFAGHEDQYALIGGTACDLLFANAGIDFRATKDFDMVLCVEAVDAVFAAAFAGFSNTAVIRRDKKATDTGSTFVFTNRPTPTTRT